jgi:hypothetical protein
MPPENYKAYIQLEHAIGGRKTRGAGAVILVKQQITEGAYANHRPDITPPVWAGPTSRRSGFATAAGLCCASLGFVSTGSIRFPPAAKVPVVDAGGAFSHQNASETNRPFKQLKRGCSIHGEVYWHRAATSRACLAMLARSYQTRFRREGSRSPSRSRKHAHPHICRRAFRSHHCGRTRPPTERESEALHRHGDEERELK